MILLAACLAPSQFRLVGVVADVIRQSPRVIAVAVMFDFVVNSVAFVESVTRNLGAAFGTLANAIAVAVALVGAVAVDAVIVVFRTTPAGAVAPV